MSRCPDRIGTLTSCTRDSECMVCPIGSKSVLGLGWTFRAGIDGKSWRCKRKGCQAVSSIRKDSFFEDSHLSLREILLIVYWWTHNLPLKDVSFETDVSERVLVDWNNFIRVVCVIHFQDNPILIGGPGKQVEIDESKFGKRNYNRGRMRDGKWVFGGCERGSTEAFMTVVNDRTAETLIPIIQAHIRPGTTIYSDQWSAYHGIASIPGYTHKTVNHSQNFVDPVTGAHTQNIESMWMQVKRKQKSMNGTSADLLPTYFQEFLWKRIFGGDQCWDNIITHIGDLNDV